MKALHTPAEVAAALQVAPKSVRAWARARRLPGYKVGGAWRFSDHDVNEFLQAQRMAKAPATAPTPSARTRDAAAGLPMPARRRFS